MSERRHQEVTGVAADVSREIDEKSGALEGIMLNVTNAAFSGDAFGARGVERYGILAGESHRVCCVRCDSGQPNPFRVEGFARHVSAASRAKRSLAVGF